VSKAKNKFHSVRKPVRTLAAICPISAAVSAILLQAGAAYADQANDIEEVIVTGLRHSIESSIETKRMSDSIVESVTAEDIGKLPDQSIAESIARLPGLAAQRVNGRASEISVRGLAPDFSVTLMNGRELLSVGNNRGIEYDQYPSELISAVTVYKTPDAALGVQGLSGTVDLRTLRPLDEKKRVLVVNGRYEKNSNGALNNEVSGMGNRFSVSYIDRFADGKVGFAINFAHLDSPEQERHFAAWGWATGMLPPPDDDVLMMFGSEVQATSAKQVRDAAMAVLDFQATESWRSAIDLYYSKYDVDTTSRGLLWSSAPGWGDGSGVLNPLIQADQRNGQRVLVGGTLTGLQPVEQSNQNARTDKLMNVGWNNALSLNQWTLESDLSYSTVKRREQTFEMYAGLGNTNDGIVDNNFGFSAPIGTQLPSFTPGMNYADASIIVLSDPAAWGGWGQDGFMRRPTVDDKLSTLRLSGKRKLAGWLNELETGLIYSDHEKTRSDNDFQFFLKNGGATVHVDADLLRSPTSLAWAGIPGVIAYDINGALGRYFDPPIVDTVQNADWKRNYTITEKVTTAFAKLNTDMHMGSVPVRGSVGVQLVHTEQGSTGIVFTSRDVSLAGGATYSDVLPSLNLNFDLSKLSRDLHLRVGASRTMARARMDDLKAGTDAGVGLDHIWSGTAGNPKLRPWLADALDLSVEKYFGKRSYMAAAAFRKNLKSYIYSVTEQFDFTGYPNPGGIPADTPQGNLGLINHPINGKGGKISGTEFSVALDGELLWSALDGFGLMGSYSLTSSDIQPYGPDITGIQIPGLSHQVGNLTFYYERAGFSTRVSRRYRSPFRAESLGPHGDRIATEIRSESIVDFQASYEIQRGAAKGLSVLLQIDNLTDAPYRTRQIGGYGGTFDAPETYNTYGRLLLLGVNYRR